MKSQSTVAWPLASIGTALLYAAAAWASLLLAIAPGYASPLYPAAGIALAGVLVFGWRVLPGVWLGSFVANAIIGGPGDVLALALAAGIASGATAQAAFGAWLVQRFCPTPLLLTEPREVASFFVLGGAVGSLVSASVGVLCLVLAGTVPAASWPLNWATWWLGDALGILIGAPIALSVVGRPRSLWVPRRRALSMPLLLVTLLAAWGMNQARQWDEARARATFEGDVASTHSALVQRLQESLHALEAMHGLFLASPEVSRQAFRAASRSWTEAPNPPLALGWLQRVDGEQVASFEQQVRREGLVDYAVFDRDGDSRRIPPAGGEVIAMRYIEPMERNARALGINVLSIPEAASAAEKARRSGWPAASAGFRLTQEPENQTGIVLYRAVYAGEPGNEAERMARTRGVLSAAFRIGDILQPVLAALPGYLQVCLVDAAANPARRRLAGVPGCEQATATALHQERELEFAQRRWKLRVSTRDPTARSGVALDTLMFSVVSLLAAATFGALLLTMTGRARRIEAAVTERTAALQREIGERARTEAALRDSEQRLRNILNHVPIGVIYTDLNGYIKQSNPKFRELVGYSVEDLAEMRSSEFSHPEDRLEDAELTRRLVEGDLSVYQRQKRYVRADGNILWVRIIVSLLRDAQGRAHRIVGVVEDITEHLKLQEAQDARELAEAANRAKSEFLSRMSHELRTPLNAMLGFAQLVELDRQQPLSDSQREWVGQIQTAGWHLLDMINDTLDLSRIESGTLKLDIEPMDLPQVIATTVSMVERSAQQRGIAITHSLSPGAVQASGDPTRVKQILTNLLTNAVKYNVDNGRVHVSTRLAEGGAIEVTVSDTGLGMNKTQLASLFQPFNRLGRERSAQEGTGIGLVISQRLAELMGGHLEVRSVEHEGSTFILTLPRAMLREPPSIDDDELELRDPDYRQRIVHYIEDNETNAVVMEGILAQRAQVKLRVSPTGLDGLAAIRSRAPSLILLDMHLPDIDGLQLLRMLKDDLATAAIPVVVVSADAVATRIQAAMDAGAEHYLTKPVNVSELLRIIDDLLEQRDTLFG